MTSMNEELQATNEELQSSQEELQSVNEELQTLNDQLLDLKIAELRESNDDLANVFRIAGIATIFVDTPPAPEAPGRAGKPHHQRRRY